MSGKRETPGELEARALLVIEKQQIEEDLDAARRSTEDRRSMTLLGMQSRQDRRTPATYDPTYPIVRNTMQSGTQTRSPQSQNKYAKQEERVRNEVGKFIKCLTFVDCHYLRMHCRRIGECRVWNKQPLTF